MDDRLIELYVQRGRLRERIGSQRTQLARELAPLGGALQLVDRSRAVLHSARQWLTAHPGVVSVLVVAVLVWRPRAVFRSLRWGFSAWRTLHRLRQWVHAG
jgi:hypothetical protein